MSFRGRGQKHSQISVTLRGEKLKKTNWYSPAKSYLLYLEWSNNSSDRWLELGQTGKNNEVWIYNAFFPIGLLSEGSRLWINDLDLLLVFRKQNWNISLPSPHPEEMPCHPSPFWGSAELSCHILHQILKFTQKKGITVWFQHLIILYTFETAENVVWGISGQSWPQK